MYLTLEVTSANGVALGGARRKVFSVDGGRIGRAPDSQMVLPGAGVHRHHATVRFINGVFFIEGIGANGIAVNNIDLVLPRNQPYPLKSGDRVFIDDFELVVTAAATPPVEPPIEPPVGPPIERPGVTVRGVPRACASLGMSSIDLPGRAEDLDPLRHLNSGAVTASQAPRAPEQRWNHSSAWSDHVAPSPITSFGSPAASPAIPEDWDETSRSQVQLQPAPPAPAPLSTATGLPSVVPAPECRAPFVHSPTGECDAGASEWSAFLRAAGVDPATVPSDTPAALGRIMRNVVQGLIEVLRARSEIKTEFRMPVTQIKASENNPLKFAANAEDALANLFGRRNSAYLPPQEAFDDALSDVRFHQLAMLAGLRAGFDHVMSRFDPEKLAEASPGHGRLGLFGAGARHWEMYSQRYREMAANRDETFRRLFGEAFARAYEQQFATLKRGRAPRRG